jgi:hypothetical protein
MNTLDLNSFDIENQAGWDQLTSLVLADLRSPSRCCLLQNFGSGETNERLIHLANSLCLIYQEPELPQHPLEDGCIFRVEARGTGIRDARNIVLYSTTSSRFPCHTDGSGKRMPYDLVILHCIKQDTTGGESILLTLDEVCARLAPDVIDVLKEPRFPVPFGLSPIIWEENGELCIRYNLEELSYYSKVRGVFPCENQQRALNTLERVILDLEEQSPPFSLPIGACLILDNKRALHGRTSLPENSERLLKRLRGYLLNL